MRLAVSCLLFLLRFASSGRGASVLQNVFVPRRAEPSVYIFKWRVALRVTRRKEYREWNRFRTFFILTV